MPATSNYIWEVIDGGVFSGTSSTTTTGANVSVDWQTLPGQLSIKRIEGGCETDPLIINVTALDLSGNTSEIQFDPGFCIDNQDPVIFTLACGPTMSPCQSGTDYEWTIDPPNAGSIVSGQGTSEVGIRWHVSNATMPELSVDYIICNQPQSVSEVIMLELPGNAEMTIDPAVVCSGSGSTFTIIPNGALAVDKVDWVLTDRAGSIFDNLGAGLTWVFDPAAFNSQPVFGTARVKATVYYDDCSFQDVVFGDVEFLYNPGVEIASFYLGPRCIRGVAQVVDVRLSTPTSSSASVGNYTWTRVCGGVTETLGAGPNVNVITVQIDPAVNCTYFLTVEREYLVDGDIVLCSIAQPFPLGFDCDSDGCEGICPEITDIINPGPGSANPKPAGAIEAFLEVGEFVRQATCKQIDDIVNDPDITVSGFTYEVQGVPSVGQYFGFSGADLSQFKDVYTEFKTFSYPALYELTAYVEGSYQGETICGETTKQVEIPYIPHMDHYLECGMGAEEGKYMLHVEDLTDVLVADKINPNDYNWVVRSLQTGALLGSGNSREEVILINQPPTESQVEICMSPLSSFTYENVGAPYQVQYCEVITIPARANANFVVNDGFPSICVEKDFKFEIVGNVDADATYHWDFGDRSSSNQPEPIKVFAQPDTYPVTLTVTNSIGCGISETQQITVVLDNFEGDIEVTPNGCNSRAIASFVPGATTGGTLPYSYLWLPNSFTDPQILVGEDAFINLEVTDQTGCTANASAVVQSLNPAFSSELSLLRTSYCPNNELSYFVTVPSASNYTYELLINSTVVDGAIQLPTSASTPSIVNLADINISPLLIVGPGLLNTLSIRVVDAGGIFCEEEFVAFEVLEAPNPPLIGADLRCDPTVVSVITLDGSLVNWRVNGSLHEVNSSELLVSPLFTSGSVSAVSVNQNGCFSESSNFEFIPQLVLPNLLSGCITDCNDAPPILSVTGFQSYNSWSWNFVPESGPIPVDCNPPTGAGSVQDWVDYLNCGNGKYSLTVEYALPSGQSCDIEIEGFCLTCPNSTCEGPVLIAENTICRYGEDPDAEYFYINFHTTNPDPADGTSLCTNGVEIDGGVFEGDYTITMEDGGSYNIEGLVRVNPNVDRTDVCVTFNFCTPDSQVPCYETTACLGNGIDDFEGECDNTSCGGIVEYDVDDSVAFCSSNPIQMQLRDIRVPISSSCEVDRVQFWSETGVISNFSVGGQQWDIDGNVDNTSGNRFFVIDELIFDYQRFTDHRDACFRFDVKCEDDSECSVSWCVDLEVECDVFFTDTDHGSTEVFCAGSDEEYNYFEVLHYFGGEQEYSDELQLINVYGGEYSEEFEFFDGGFWAFLPVVKSEDRVIMHLGSVEQERDGDTYLFPGKNEPIEGYRNTEGDILVAVLATACEEGELEKRTSRRPSDAQSIVKIENPTSLAITPNPLTRMGSLEVSQLANDIAVDWNATRIFAVNGAEQEAQLSLVSSTKAEIEVDALAPGLYFVQVTLSDGSLLQSRFVKH